MKVRAQKVGASILVWRHIKAVTFGIIVPSKSRITRPFRKINFRFIPFDRPSCICLVFFRFLQGDLSDMGEKQYSAWGAHAKLYQEISVYSGLIYIRSSSYDFHFVALSFYRKFSRRFQGTMFLCILRKGNVNLEMMEKRMTFFLLLTFISLFFRIKFWKSVLPNRPCVVDQKNSLDDFISFCSWVYFIPAMGRFFQLPKHSEGGSQAKMKDV